MILKAPLTIDIDRSSYTYRGWHRVTNPCQPPAKAGGLCIHWQTAYMPAPAFDYYDTWHDVPAIFRDLQAIKECQPW